MTPHLTLSGTVTIRVSADTLIDEGIQRWITETQDIISVDLIDDWDWELENPNDVYPTPTVVITLRLVSR